MSKTFFNSKQKILDSGIRTTFTGVLHVYHKSQLGITNTEIRLPHGLSLAAILTSAVACTVCRLPCLYRTAAEPSPRSLSESLVFSRQIVIRLNVIQNNKTKLTKTMSTYTLEKKGRLHELSLWIRLRWVAYSQKPDAKISTPKRQWCDSTNNLFDDKWRKSLGKTSNLSQLHNRWHVIWPFPLLTGLLKEFLV